MPKMKRVLVGGLGGGLVIFGITGMVNGAILSTPLHSWVLEMGPRMTPPPFPVALLLWFVMSWLLGTSGVWIFARIAAQSHSVAMSAIRAGMLVWVASKAVVALDFIALGILPAPLLVGQLVGGLVEILLGVYGGARLYSYCEATLHRTSMKREFVATVKQ